MDALRSMQARGSGYKSIGLIAAALAAVAAVIWLKSDRDDSDTREIASAPVSDASPAVDWTGLEPSKPPTTTETRPPGRDAIRVVSVNFPDGTSIAVPLRSMPHPSVRIEGGLTTLADFYRQVAPQAQAGDPAAAWELARKLRQCKELLSRKEGVEHVRDQLPAEPFWLDFCRETDASILDEADMWRQAAIDAGYYFAIQELARDLRGTRQELEIWESLWQRGHASVLQVLKIRYSEGVAGSPPDYIRAYAHKLIEFGLMQAAISDSRSPTPNQRLMLIMTEDSLRQAGSYLTPGETATAVALAVEILRSNRNCCIGRWG
jgi:hypothetical protein